jgi:hypothetical protein
MSYRIRTKLDDTPTNHESIDDSETPTIAIFLGDCCGIRLVWRMENDPHVCFEILGEDDGHWFIKSDSSSSYWMPDLMKALKAAEKWMKANCKPHIHNGHQCGYTDTIRQNI